MKAYDVAPRRKRNAITQDQLATSLGWTKSTLIDIELGRVDVTEEQVIEMHLHLDEIEKCRGEATVRKQRAEIADENRQAAASCA